MYTQVNLNRFLIWLHFRVSRSNCKLTHKILFFQSPRCVTTTKAKKEAHTRAPPITYSVKARATRPNMANLPFHNSALEFISPSVFDSGLSPLNKGTKDAMDRRMLVPRNHWAPPSDIWESRSVPLDSSTARAATNPIMANRPLILSGPGPLKANTSAKLVLACDATRLLLPD